MFAGPWLRAWGKSGGWMVARAICLATTSIACFAAISWSCRCVSPSAEAQGWCIVSLSSCKCLTVFGLLVVIQRGMVPVIGTVT